MSLLRPSTAALLLLSACVSTHPDDGYTPYDLDIGASNWRYETDSGALDAAPPPLPDAGPPSANEHPLAGYYLIRIDGYTTASTSTLAGVVHVQSRASQLLVTHITGSGEQLVGRERLCHQLIEHECQKPCSSFTTQLLDGALQIARRRLYDRTYTLGPGGALSTNRVVMQLGFEDLANPDALPTTQDPRVWDSSPDEPGLEGMITKAVVKHIGGSSECYVFNTQRFASSFSGKMPGGAPSLEGTWLQLDTTGGGGEIVGAGGPAANDCKQRPKDNPTLLRQSVRFVRARDQSDAVFRCPDANQWPTPDAI